MAKVTQRTLLDFEKSAYFIDHFTLENGSKYIEIIQKYKEGRTQDGSIKINAANLPTILYVLSKYSDGLPKPEMVKDFNVSKRAQEKIASAYLKGVSIADLGIQTGLSADIIEKVITDAHIVIVPPEPPKTISKTRKRRRWKK